MGNLISRIIRRESFTISSVSFLDADQLIRECDFPAMLDNPLRLLMFPSSNPTTSEEERSYGKSMDWKNHCKARKSSSAKSVRVMDPPWGSLGGQLIRDLKE